ncbi:DNA primase [Marinobacter sp.]|uniref:DNA primase n=1 Tax=Marinobacter sp. TaxID=50741 RepID=UPI003568B4CC
MAKSGKLVSDAFIQELLDRANIVKVIDSRLGGKLKKVGRDYKCPCPFHDEKTPSFTVSEERQIFTCFGGCFGGKGSNAINFIREFEQVSFKEAVTRLCEEVGMEPPFENEEKLDPKAQRKKQIFAALSDAKDLYQNLLRDPKYQGRAVEYLKKRGFSGEVAKEFGIGVAPEEWAITMKRLSNKHGADVLKEAGLLAEKNGKKFDLFRDRIMFPINDQRGRVIGFGGRRLNDESNAPKYINSPETLVFKKSNELYNFDKAQLSARKAGKLFIVEGYTDVIAHAQFGIDNTAAPLGTAFTEGQLSKVLTVTSDPVMCFDGDRAGREAAWKAMMMSLPHLNDGIRMQFLFYPEGQDPDTLLRAEGIDAYQARLEGAMPLSRFVITELKNRYGDDSPEAKASIASEAATVISKMPHGIYREVMLKATAQAIDLPEQRLVDAMLKQHPEATVTPAHPTKGRPNPEPVQQAPSKAPAPAPTARTNPASKPGNHFTGGGLVPGMLTPKTTAAPRFQQFQARHEQEIKTLRSTGDVEGFTRKAVKAELQATRGAVNARYLADNLTQTIESFVGKQSAKEMAPKIRNYTLAATQEFNKRLADYESGTKQTMKPGEGPSQGMGMSR